MKKLVRAIDYYLLLKIRKISFRFTNYIITLKTMKYILLYTFILLNIILSLMFYSIIKVIYKYIPFFASNYNIIWTALYILYLISLSVLGINALNEEMFDEKDRDYILHENYRKNITSKFLSCIFLKNIYIPSVVFVSINISKYIVNSTQYSFSVSILRYISMLLIPIIIKFIIMVFNLYTNQGESFFKNLFINTSIIFSSYFVSDILFSGKIEINDLINSRVFESIIKFFPVALILIIILFIISINKLKKERPELDNTNKNLLNTKIIMNNFNKDIVNTEYIIYNYFKLLIKRSKYELNTLLATLTRIFSISLGVIFSFKKNTNIETNMIFYFMLIVIFEISQNQFKYLFSLEKDRSIIRSLIAHNKIYMLLKNKLKVYTIMFYIVSIIIILLNLIFGNIINIIGFIIAIILLSNIYSYFLVVSNMISPNFFSNKNEEENTSIVNEFISAILGVINLLIYQIIGLLLLSYNYADKISIFEFWTFLFAIMIVHVLILKLIYNTLVKKEIWRLWEGV